MRCSPDAGPQRLTLMVVALAITLGSPLAACNQTPAAPAPTAVPGQPALPVAKPAGGAAQPAQPAPAKPAAPAPTPVPTRPPVPTPVPTQDVPPLVETPLTGEAGLAFRPGGELIDGKKIPAGAKVMIFGRDEETSKWLRILWSDYVGWVPLTATNFRATKVPPLRSPPPCAQPLWAGKGLDAEWGSPASQRIAIVIDLYRTQDGSEFPSSTVQVKVDGKPVPEKDRMVKSNGIFLLRGTAIGINVQTGNKVSVGVQTSSREQVKAFLTVYRVPNGCKFGD